MTFWTASRSAGPSTPAGPASEQDAPTGRHADEQIREPERQVLAIREPRNPELWDDREVRADVAGEVKPTRDP